MLTLEFYSALSSIITGPLSFLFVVMLTLDWRFSPRTMRILIPAFLVLLSEGSAAYFVESGVNDDTKLYTALFAILSFIAFNLLFSRYPLLEVQSELQRKKWLWMMVVPLLMCFVFFYVVQMQGPL